jgi:hypothetical protein
VEYSVVDQPKSAQESQLGKEPDPVDPIGCSVDQRRRLRDLFSGLGATDEQINKALGKRGVKMIRELTAEQADEIIHTLEAKLAAAAEATAGKSRLPDDAKSSDVTGPVDQATIDRIKSLMKDDYELAVRVKEHLQQHNKNKLAELSREDGAALLDALESKSIETFFARSLQQGPF